MDSSYKLGKKKKLFELAEFPIINKRDKVVILFTGGVKSYLAAYIAKQMYGIENVIFGFISMDAFGNFKNGSEKLEISKKNYNDGFKRLGGIHKFEINNNGFTTHKQMHQLHNKNILDKFPSVKYCISGYNKMYEETMKMLIESGWEKGHITKHQLTGYIKNNSVKYETLNNKIETFEQPIPFTNSQVGFNELQTSFYAMVRPFHQLEDHEIIELYDRMNLLHDLYQAKSCEISKKVDEHCGNCRNCLQRKDAFFQANIRDITKYSFN